jgi:AcrR family transcriptional regulator
MNERRGNPPRQQVRLDPAVRRAQLVQAAASVFRGREPSEVSFEEVADAAGVSRSLVYAYFGDRGGLISAVFLHDLEMLDAELGRALDDHLPDEVRLRRIIRRYLQFARDNRHTWELLTSVGSLQHPAVQAAKRDRIDRIAASWGGSHEARLVARGVVGLLEASADDWVTYRDCGIERATDIVFHVLWGGLSGMAEEIAV